LPFVQPRRWFAWAGPLVGRHGPQDKQAGQATADRHAWHAAALSRPSGRPASTTWDRPRLSENLPSSLFQKPER